MAHPLLRLLVLAGALLTALTGTAHAASPVITLDNRQAASSPGVAVSPTGTAFIAWVVSNPAPAPAPDTIRYCRLPRGASACDVTLDLIPSGVSFHRPSVLVRPNGHVQVVIGRDLGNGSERSYLYDSANGGASFGPVAVIGDKDFDQAIAGPGENGITLSIAGNYSARPLQVQVGATNTVTLASANLEDGNDRKFVGGLGLIDSATPIFAYSDLENTFVRRFDSTKSGYNNGANWLPPVELPGENAPTLVTGLAGTYVMTHLDLGGEANQDAFQVRRVNENDGTLGAPQVVSDVGASNFSDLSADGGGGVTAIWTAFADPSPIRAASAPTGGTFGRPGTLVESASAFNLQSATADDHGGVVVWDGNSAGTVSVAAIPAGGPVSDPLPPTPGPGPSPGPAPAPVEPPAGPCQKLALSKDVTAIAKGGCWVNKPAKSKHYEYDGTVDVNGIILSAPAGKKSGVEVDLSTKVLTAPAGTRQSAGAIVLSTRKVDWPFAKTNVQTFDALESAGPGGKAIQLLGFGVTGSAKVTFTSGAADVEPNLVLPFPFDGLTAATKLRVTPAGLQLQGASFSVSGAMVGPLQVKHFAVALTDGLSGFRGDVQLVLPGAGTEIDGRIGFDDGALTQLSVTVKGGTPFPLAVSAPPVIYLTGVGFRYANKDGLTLGGGAELSFPSGAGPFFFDALGDPPGTGAGFNLHIPKGKDYAEVSFGGRFKVAFLGQRLDIGGVSSTLNTGTGQFELHSDIGIGNDLIGMNGHVDGGINVPKRAFYAKGDLKVCLIACLGSEVVVSSIGAAGCVDLTFVELLVGYKWDSGLDAGLSCDTGPYVPAPFRDPSAPAEPVGKEPEPQLVTKDVIDLPSRIPEELAKQGLNSKAALEELKKTKVSSVEVSGDGGVPALELTEAGYSAPGQGPGGTITKAQLLPYSPSDRVILATDPGRPLDPIQAGDVIMVPSPATNSVRITFIQRGQGIGGASNLPATGSVRIRQIGGAAIKFGTAPGGPLARRAQAGAPGIRFARTYDDTVVKAKLSGKVRARKLTWEATNLGASGRTVELVEQSTSGATKLLKTTKATDGSVSFSPADGPAGKRQINAIVRNWTGLAISTKTVATYTAPGPERPTKPTRLKLKLGGKGKLKVSWSGSTGAKTNLVEVQVADGRRLQLITKKRTVTIPDVAKNERVTVTIRGLSKTALRGPSAKGKYGR